jgi:hypothetical protein
MLRFSPCPRSNLLGAARHRPLRLTAANDNPAGRDTRELPLATALKMFAAHGHSAASQAGQNARAAALVDDDAGFAHWIAVCRALDRRLAREIETRRTRGRL